VVGVFGFFFFFFFFLLFFLLGFGWVSLGLGKILSFLSGFPPRCFDPFFPPCGLQNGDFLSRKFFVSLFPILFFGELVFPLFPSPSPLKLYFLFFFVFFFFFPFLRCRFL